MEGFRTLSERRALENLNSLFEESEPKDLINTIDLESPLKGASASSEAAPQKSSLKKTSSLYPAPSSNQGVSTFLKMTCQEIRNLKSKSTILENLTKNKKIALRNLSSHHEITIKASDKMGNIVLMDNEKYSQMCMKILTNCDWYRPVGPDVGQAFNNKFYALVDEAFQNKVISKQTLDFIRTPHPRLATFYSLPKIHKHTSDPPGRPIISGSCAITENLSRLVDEHIRPFVLSISSYVRDTIHLLQIIEGMQIPGGCILASIDVEALYSSVPHSKGLACVQKILSQTSHHESSFNDFILLSLDYILRHNVFSFDDRLFLQVQGVARGTCCVPGGVGAVYLLQ